MKQIGLFHGLDERLSILDEFRTKTYEARKNLADYVRNNAIEIKIPNGEQWFKVILNYLWNHNEAIIKFNSLHEERYYFFINGMNIGKLPKHCYKTMPYVRIVGVDDSNPWMIVDPFYTDDERIVYLKRTGHNCLVENHLLNTKISFLYRDASNYKMWTDIIVETPINSADIDRILNCCNEGMYFIPEQLGLPANRFPETTDDDHPWCELERDGFSLTDKVPTVDMDMFDLVRKFEAAKGNWDEMKYS